MITIKIKNKEEFENILNLLKKLQDMIPEWQQYEAEQIIEEIKDELKKLIQEDEP